MSGCGRNCACARGVSDMKEEVCPAPKGGVALDKEGKCPCGKSADDCCHKEMLWGGQTDENPAILELCKPHGKQHLCES